MNEANPKFNRPTLRRAQRFLWLVLALIAGLGLQPQAARAQMTNDAFASAEVITDLSGTANGSNNLATLEACEPNPVDTDDSGPTLIGASVWYKWIAPTNGTVTFDTINSDFDTVLAVYTTSNNLCSANLTLVGADDQGFGATGDQSTFSFPVVAGKTYYISVSGWNGDTGTVALNWDESPALPPTIPSGTFQFTKSLYLVSELDSLPPVGQDGGTVQGNIGGFPYGARVTVTRTGGSKGRVLVDVVGLPQTYTNSFNTNYFGTNYFYATVDTNGVCNATNITQAITLSSNSYQSKVNGNYIYYAVINAYTNTITQILLVQAPPLLTSTNFPLVSGSFLPLPVAIPGVTNGVTSLRVVNQPFPYTNFTTNTTFMFINTNGINTNYNSGNTPNVTFITQPPTNDFGAVGTNRVTLTTFGPVAFPPTTVFGGFTYTNPVIYWTNAFQLSYCYGSNVVYVQKAPPMLPFFNTNSFYTNYVYTNFSSLVYAVYTNGAVGLTRTNTFVSAINYPSGVTNFTFSERDNVGPNDNNVFTTPLGLFQPYPTNLPPIGNFNLGFSRYTNTDSSTNYTSTNSFRNPPTVALQTIAASGAFSTLNNTLVFDDYQMSADIIVPVAQAASPNGGVLPSIPSVIALQLANPRLDVLESGDLIPPTTSGGDTEVNALSTSYPPGPSLVNFERSTFTVDKDVAGGVAIISVKRSGYAGNAISVKYIIDPVPVLQPGPAGSPAPETFVPGRNPANTFPLESGSDYALPNSDFTPVTGTLNWGIGDTQPKQISIPILNNGLVENNADLLVQLYEATPWPPSMTDPGGILGLVNACTVTVLFDDRICGQQPAGAVDRCWNKDGFSDSNPPFLLYPGTQGGVSGSANGNGGTVYALAEQPDGKAIVAGSFTSFDSNPYRRLVRLLANGYQDTTFMAAPNSGANGGVYAVAVQTNGQIIIGGDFTSFNGANRRHIARLNVDGTVDNTFTPGLGADGTVQAVDVRDDGKITIGGNFTNVNGVASSYVARLNSDGTLDTNFNVGTLINGPVYALASGGATTIHLNVTPFGTELEDVQTFALGTNATGSLKVLYDFLTVPDDMRVYYGGTNGVRIYDTGLTNGSRSFTLPFGPTNGVTTNIITIVMNQGNGIPGTLWIYDAFITTFSEKVLFIGGAFDSVNGTPSGGVARLKDDGSLDTRFAPGIGTYNPNSGHADVVHALALQPNGRLLVGGSFSYFDLASYNGLVRLGTDGTVDTTFNPGTGTYDFLNGQADSVFSIKLQDDEKILVGGDFAEFNQTRRWGVARLFSYGSVDTSFMDNCYNQFAGLVNHYHNVDAVNPVDYPSGNHRNKVLALAVEPSTANVIIGGSFLRVGGGLTRDDTHPRSNVARLIGDKTPGPDNIQLTYDKYSVDKSAVTLFVSMIRTNGSLGPISATFYTNTAAPGPGIANADDFSIASPLYRNPLWPTIYLGLGPNFSWTESPGIYGPNYFTEPAPHTIIPVFLGINNNSNFTGNVNASLGLSNPSGSTFTLGGEFIGLSPALGYFNAAPLTILENNFKPGVIGYSSPAFTVNQNGGTATITVTRTNGTDGIVSVFYSSTNGTATNGINFTATSGTLTFNQGVASRTFTIPIINGTTVQPDKTVNLMLSTITGGATIGLANAVLTIVNNNFTPGHVSFTSVAFTTNEPATTGNAVISVNRLGGSSGTLQVTFAATNGTATNGVQFTGVTNTLTWNNGDVSTKTVNVPLLHDGIFTAPDLNVTLRLYNAKVNTLVNPNALGLNTNVLLTIANIDFPGTVQFTSDRYSVKKYAGYALIPVVRTGGSSQTISVTYATADGSAMAPGDYISTNGTLTFTNGVVSQFIKVPIVNTNFGGGLKSLTVQLSGMAAGVPSLATLNIIDTDNVNETPGTDDTTYSPTAGFNGAVFALALQTNNNKLVVGGDFTQANGVPRQRIARLNANGTLDASFSLPSSTMGADAAVRAVMVQSDGRVVLGGFFTNCNSVVYNHIARLNQDGALDSLFNSGSGADNPIYALAETFAGADRKILVGGSFASLDGVTFHDIGRLNDDGTPDGSFNPGGLGANGTVFALAVQTDGKVVIGGDFSSVNGVTANHVARLNVDGTMDPSFTGSGANGSVQAVKVQLDGKILVGGAFTSVNGTNVNHIVRLNSNGSVDNSFTPGVGADDVVSAITLQTDNRIVLGGQFTHCSGVSRSRITRLNPDGTVDPTINFGSGADGFVAAIVIQQDTIAGYPADVPDEKIIIGGGFTHYFGHPHQRIARIYGGSISGVGAFEFSMSDFSVTESTPNAFITVIRTGGTMGTNADGSGVINVPFMTSDGSALAGTNYVGTTNIVVFPLGEVQQTVTIPIIHDLVITPDLEVNLQVNPVLPAQYGSQAIAVLHILNDDSEVNLSSPTYQVAKNVINGVATINVLRLGGSSGTSSVIFNTTTNGSAVDGQDYTPVTNYLVTFNPGVTNVAVNIPIINNALPQGFRSVEIQLTNPVNTVLYYPSNAVLTIIDTVNSPGQISLTATNYNVRSSDTNAVLTLTRTNGSSGIVTVNYQTYPGTAAPGVDYTASSGLVTFAGGVTSQTISIPLLPQSAVKPPVAFSVVLTNVQGGAQLIAPSNATVNIVSAIAGISFVAATNTVPENSGTAVVAVQRLFNTTNSASVHYATANGSASAGINYVNTSGTLNFTNGETLKVLSIPLINRTNVTGDLTFSVKLSLPAGAQLLAQSNTVVVMQDADAGISFTNSTVRVLKSSGLAVITVVCSNPRVEPVILTTNDVPLRVSYFTADGTALAGQDYQAASGVLVFTNGIATNTFTVPLFNNLAVTGDRAFTVILTNVTPPGQITPYGTQSVVIAESNPGFRFSQSAYTVFENGAVANINVYRTGFTDTVASVNFTATNGTAVNGANYVATNGTLVFTNGETVKPFAVQIIANSAVQPNLTVLLQLLDPTNGVLVAPSAAVLNILEAGGSYVIPAGAALLTESGPMNGIIDSNETVTVLFAFRDSAGLNVTNLIAYLLATNGVTSPSPASQVYGPLTVYGHSVSRPFTFTAFGTNALPIAANFNLFDNAHFIGTAVFGFTVGTWTTSFTNTNSIVIYDNTNALPYPSVISVSGVGGTLIKATVVVNGLTHTSPSDVAALVVAPGGTNTLLMANTGGQFTVTNIVLTFDDGVTNTLPQNARLATGTNRPTQFFPVKNFP